MDMGIDRRLIGTRLRQARGRAGLTLEELGTQTQISTSTLSRIESGVRQPNLETLVPICRALGIHIDPLLAPPAQDPRVELPAIRHEGMILKPLTPAHFPVRAVQITYPVQRTRPAPRTHEGREWLVVTSGELTLELAGAEYALGSGQAAEFDTSIPHALWSIGPEPAVAVSIFDHQGAQAHIPAPSANQ